MKDKGIIEEDALSTCRKFRKRPIVVEAFQMTNYRFVRRGLWPAWLIDGWNKPNHVLGSVYNEYFPLGENHERIMIKTLEGVHGVDIDDYIIQGAKGELYPCKPDIFEITYEEVL